MPGKKPNKFLALLGFTEEEDEPEYETERDMSEPEPGRQQPSYGNPSNRYTTTERPAPSRYGESPRYNDRSTPAPNPGPYVPPSPRIVSGARRDDSLRLVSNSAEEDITTLKMVLYKPLNFEETQSIIDTLKSRRSMVVNLEELDQTTAIRVLDFMSGAVYALDGSIRKVSKGIFVLAPTGVDITGSISANLPGEVRNSSASRNTRNRYD